VPAFAALRTTRAWAGHYEMNRFDGNALIGRAEACENLYLITGFSGHGMQHAPAAGRGLAELIAFGAYRSLDLSPLSPARMGRGEPLIESNII
jgi:glycine/D-amino acid oxidase-like deaminating enzyme